jgi:hypothetical protein
MNIGGIIASFAANINGIAASFERNAAFFSQGDRLEGSRCMVGRAKVQVWDSKGVGK